MERIQCAIGIVVIAVIAVLISSDRKAIPRRAVVWGFALHILLAALFLAFPPGVAVFQQLGNAVTWFLGFATEGSSFLFGRLPLPDTQPVVGFQFALIILSVIIFFSSAMAVLYHYGIMQRIVAFCSRILERTMQTGPIESISAVANIFLGQTEAPLLVRHYIPAVSSSEMFAIMVGGFATIAGSTMGVYVARGINAADLMVASIVVAPGALALAKMVEPPRSRTFTPAESVHLGDITAASNALDAIARGAMDGARLAMNVIVVLIAFKAIVSFLDAGLALLDPHMASIGVEVFPSSMNEILSWVFYPFAWMMGVPSSETAAVASLLGTKITMTEFIAYDQLATQAANNQLSPRSIRLTTIALCGFANIMSVGIQIGGFGMMAPERRSEVARFGLKAMFVGMLANVMTACVAGLLISDETS